MRKIRHIINNLHYRCKLKKYSKKCLTQALDYVIILDVM